MGPSHPLPQEAGMSTTSLGKKYYVKCCKVLEQGLITREISLVPYIQRHVGGEKVEQRKKGDKFSWVQIIQKLLDISIGSRDIYKISTTETN